MNNIWVNIRYVLPDANKRVLIKYRSNYDKLIYVVIGIRFVIGDNWYFSYYGIDGTNTVTNEEVTHWMNLPK